MDTFIGIDVGTGSARAGIFDIAGKCLNTAVQPIKMWTPKADFVEQSSEDIWVAVCHCVQGVLKDSKVEKEQVKGIGFDATCSLVALDQNDDPVTVSPTGKDEQNIIVWMDHRAIEQTARINATRHGVLDYVGGTISPEMETPKLLWLKENMSVSWQRTTRFFDLPDFLTYRATGDDTRSLCSTVCKWTYLKRDSSGNDLSGWDDSFFKIIGLGDLVDEGYERIGQRVRPMGEPVGNGLSDIAANELGLNPGTPVGVSIIDAHAGGIGMLGASLDSNESIDYDRRLALIGGTSSCHMAVSKESRLIRGIWGPYYSAMIPDFWLAEGGQSATGSLVDHTIKNHGAATELEQLAREQNISSYEFLNKRLELLAVNKPFPAVLTEELHVCPYFHGNRSPRANPALRGMISGLRLSTDLDDLALLYLATIQAIAYGTRHIIEEMNAKGYSIDTIFACGGGIKNPVFLREHADITDCRIVLTTEPEAVLIGSAILGAVSSGNFGSVTEAMTAMTTASQIIEPATGPTKIFHDKKYSVFHRMYEHQLNYKTLMK